MHPQGNPHVQANPHNIAVIAAVLATRIGRLDPGNAAVFSNRLEDFLSRWQAGITNWESRATHLRGKRVVAHHKSWVYLEDWLGIEELATLEPVPGIPPTAGHLSKLVSQLGDDVAVAEFIIRSPYQSDRASEWLSERTGIRAVRLLLIGGGSVGAKYRLGLVDDILSRLLGESP